MKKRRVVYWNRIPSPYIADRFNALADNAPFEFEVWFTDRSKSDRSWDVDENSWRFNYRYIPTTRILEFIFHWPIPVIFRRPDLIVSGYSELSWIVGWLLAKLLGIRTCFRILKGSESWTKRNPLKEFVKRFMLRHVDAVETPGEDGKNYAISLGCAADKIHFATHTVADIYFREPDARKATLLSEHLGLRGIVFIYVGRLWNGKGVQYLLDAYEKFQQSTNTEATLLLVGDGVDEASFRKLCADRKIQHVVFAGFVQRDALPTYYAVSDVFVFPTLGDPYGLVVDEAMACSLPVLSTSVAGEITTRVENGVNGYIVPPSDSQALADRMLQLAESRDVLNQMGKASREKILTHTPEQWAKDFQKMVASVLAQETIA